MALLGGHVSATHIASLSCTNSSMYFKLNALPRLKMWLPVVPVSMAILGKNKVLPRVKTEKTNWRHRLLKCIAHATRDAYAMNVKSFQAYLGTHSGIKM
ncbi:hypothetical protein Ddye_006473 [Dipteronia dyeriana]|uniref:Uncharacterized protein n=1 Tax=Dipteronia dyeriana TaxID=168575 RepID=A0AAD9XI48_9ROSI|nr:hypothetical protein Ddye_006473 [Dipteronia dyeriana]